MVFVKNVKAVYEPEKDNRTLKITFTGDIAGDKEAAVEYLKKRLRIILGIWDLIEIDKSHMHLYRREVGNFVPVWKCRCGEWRIFFPRLQHDNDTPFDWDRDKKLEGPKLGDTPF